MVNFLFALTFLLLYGNATRTRLHFCLDTWYLMHAIDRLTVFHAHSAGKNTNETSWPMLARRMRINKNNINKSEWQAGSDFMRRNQWACCARCVFGAANKWNLFITKRNNINLNKCIGMKFNLTEAITPADTNRYATIACSVLTLFGTHQLQKPSAFVRWLHTAQSQLIRIDTSNRSHTKLPNYRFIYSSFNFTLHSRMLLPNEWRKIQLKSLQRVSFGSHAWCALSFQVNFDGR